jgi:hypothetical protein
VSVVERVIERRLTQREAARMLGLTSRQVRRLRRAYERDGRGGLASKHRGRPSNRRLASELRREALAIVRSRYEGFGPTLAYEKLTGAFSDREHRVDGNRPPRRPRRAAGARAVPSDLPFFLPGNPARTRRLPPTSSVNRVRPRWRQRAVLSRTVIR